MNPIIQQGKVDGQLEAPVTKDKTVPSKRAKTQEDFTPWQYIWGKKSHLE